MKIYITRHSKTIWNEEKRLQGWKDSPLTNQGKEDAKELKKYLEHLSIDHVYSSPIKRAYDTATLLFDQEIIIDDRLKEMNFGDYEGKLINNLFDDKDYNDLWNCPKSDFGLKNGETYQEVYDRLNDFLKEIYCLHSNETVFIVIHGMLFTIFLGIVYGLKIEELTKVNSNIVQGCSLTDIDFDGNNFVINYIGKNDFLTNQESIRYNKKD